MGSLRITGGIGTAPANFGHECPWCGCKTGAASVWTSDGKLFCCRKCATEYIESRIHDPGYAKEEKIREGVENVKKGIVVIVLKIILFFIPLIAGVHFADSIKAIVNNTVLIIVFAVIATALWIGFFILGKKVSNRFAKMCFRFIRRIFFGGAAEFALLACEMLGLAQQTAS